MGADKQFEKFFITFVALYCNPPANFSIASLM
jgi:hypothetical protein